MSSPRFQMVRQENCTLHYLAFGSLFSQQIPLDVRRRRKKSWIDTLFQVVGSGSGAFASFSTFTGTGEAVELSKLSAAEARHGGAVGGGGWHFSNIFYSLRTGSGAFTITICPVCARNAVAIRFYGIHFCWSNKIRWHVAARYKERRVISSLLSMTHMWIGTGCWLMLN